MWKICHICSQRGFFFYVFSTGSSLNSQIYQTPAQLYISKETEEVKINCSHSIQGYDRIFWYRQMNNRHLQFLGYVYGTVDNPEKGLDVKLKGDANKNKTCTLTIEKLGPNSSAVYFCAVTQHNARKHCTSVQKPHHVFPLSTRCCTSTCEEGFFPSFFFKVSFLLSGNTQYLNALRCSVYLQWQHLRKLEHYHDAGFH